MSSALHENWDDTDENLSPAQPEDYKDAAAGCRPNWHSYYSVNFESEH